MDYKNISELHEWDKNKEVRQITEANFLKLKANIKRNGIESVFKILEDGTVLDGNHRLRVIQALLNEGVTTTDNGHDITQVPYEIKQTSSEADKWRIALNGNSEYASYTENLSNYMPEFENEIDLSLINVDFSTPASLDEYFPVDDPEKEVKPQKEPREIECPACHDKFTQTKGGE